jgi:hypothetical protein
VELKVVEVIVVLVLVFVFGGGREGRRSRNSLLWSGRSETGRGRGMDSDRTGSDSFEEYPRGDKSISVMTGGLEEEEEEEEEEEARVVAGDNVVFVSCCCFSRGEILRGRWRGDRFLGSPPSDGALAGGRGDDEVKFMEGDGLIRKFKKKKRKKEKRNLLFFHLSGFYCVPGETLFYNNLNPLVEVLVCLHRKLQQWRQMVSVCLLYLVVKTVQSSTELS